MMAPKAIKTASNLPCWIAIALWNLIVAIDSTALSTALPTIAQDVHASSDQAFWLGTSFVLASAALQPAYTSLADALGRKPVAFLSLVLFTAGTIICGPANEISILLLGRVVQGAGAGGLLAITYVLMADLVPLESRGRYMSIIGLTWMLGTCCGPVLGGGFTASASWRWIFYFNLPFCAICLVVVLFFMPGIPWRKEGCVQGLRRMDWLGIVLFTGSVTSFLLGLSLGGTTYAWRSARTIAPLIIGALGLGLWTTYSLLWTSTPMIPLRTLLSSRTALISYLQTIIQGLCQFAVLFYLPLYYQVEKGLSPVLAGVALLPICVLSGPSTAITGILISRTRRVVPFALAAWIVFALGLGLLVLLHPNSSTAQWIFITAPVGLGVGMLFSPLAIATQAAAETSSADPSQIARLKGVAAGLNPFFRALGQALGVVVAQAIFTNEMRRRVGPALAQEAAGLAQTVQRMPEDEARTALIDAFDGSLRVVWWVIFALAAACILPTLLTRETGLRRVDGNSVEHDPTVSEDQGSDWSSRRTTVGEFETKTGDVEKA